MWTFRRRSCLFAALTAYSAGLPDTANARRVVHAPAPVNVAANSHGDGRDIVFAARLFRKSGVFYRYYNKYSSHGDLADETLTEVSRSAYVVRPDGTGLRRIAPKEMECETPQWSPDGAKILFVGSTATSYRHLYTVDPDGTHLVQLTDGNSQDTSARWSPDGRFVVFCRHDSADGGFHVDENCGTVCLVSVDKTTGASRRVAPIALCTPPDDLSGPYRIAISGNSHFVSVAAGVWYDRIPRAFYMSDVSDPTHPKVRQESHIVDAVWSPNGRYAYLTGSDNTDHILDIVTGNRVTVSDPVMSPHWLDNEQVFGDMYPERSQANEEGELRIINRGGKLIRKRKLVAGRSLIQNISQEQIANEASEIDGDYGHDWKPVPGNSVLAILSATHGMSDGHHYNCYRVNLRTGVFQLIRGGRFLAFSPDGRTFLAADYNWVGPYKRGGERVGPLEIVDVRTGRARALSSRLAILSGADW